MGFSNFFGWGGGNEPVDELPIIFPLDFKKDNFIEIDCINIYQKILTDVMDRTQGMSDEQMDLLWDNCIQSEASHGLISLLARAMAFRRNLFLVYDRALNVLRIATFDEQEKIREDYAKQGSSTTGVFISFVHYLKSDLIRLYSALEYCTIGALNKSMHLSTAIQLKMSDLRQSVSLNDSAEVKEQAQRIAKSLSNGRDILIDAKDIIENAMPKFDGIHESFEYISQKRAFYLGLPASYITGLQTAGIGSTGEADTKATERGLKNYYHSVVKPVLKVLFDVDANYKSQDFRQVDQGLNALKTFSLTDEELLSLENKTLILNRLFDLDEDAEGDGPEPKETLPPDQVYANNANDQI